MEFLSESRLQKYSDILDKIKQKHEESLKLEQELEKENNRFMLYSLAQNKTILYRLSQVNVKVFADLVELFNLYEEDILGDVHDFLEYKNYNFYLVEIHLSKDLIQKLRGFEYHVNICVRYGFNCVNRTVRLRKKLPMYEIIPVEEEVVKSTVETTLFLHDEFQCMRLLLENVHVDASYYFSNLKKPKSMTKTETILQITKMHSKDKELHFKYVLPNIEYVFPVKVSDFISAVSMNSYHNLNIQVLAELENKNSNKLDFLFGKNKKISIIVREGKIILNASYADMVELKTCLFKMLTNPSDTSNISKHISKLQKLKSYPLDTPGDIKAIYFDARELWANITT